MSNFKMFFHRFFQSSCRQSQEKMFAKWNTLSSLAGGAWKSQCMKFMQDQMTMLKAVGLQCNMIAAHRVKRTLQIVQLYRNLYGKKSPAQFLEKLSSLVKANPQEKMLFLLGAAFFDWKGNRVSETDMTRIEEDLRPFFDHKIADTPFHDKSGDVWELVFNKESFKLWRCPVPGTSLYKYRIHGSYKDIPATAFFNIQLDLDYRKQWDRHIVQLEKVAEDQETGSEIVYWATHFPLGILYDRDYLYVRRYKVDPEQNYMMLMAKSVQHPQFPETKQFVRVAEYSSQMVIRPHSKFEENGFDYVMSYYDNPHLYVPTYIINKLTQSSMPAFLEELHVATKNLVKSHVKIQDFQHQQVPSQQSTREQIRNTC